METLIIKLTNLSITYNGRELVITANGTPPEIAIKGTLDPDKKDVKPICAAPALQEATYKEPPKVSTEAKKLEVPDVSARCLQCGALLPAPKKNAPHLRIYCSPRCAGIAWRNKQKADRFLLMEPLKPEEAPPAGRGKKHRNECGLENNSSDPDHFSPGSPF